MYIYFSYHAYICTAVFLAMSAVLKRSSGLPEVLAISSGGFRVIFSGNSFPFVWAIFLNIFMASSVLLCRFNQRIDSGMKLEITRKLEQAKLFQLVRQKTRRCLKMTRFLEKLQRISSHDTYLKNARVNTYGMVQAMNKIFQFLMK